MKRPLLLRLSALDHGWAVELTDGRYGGRRLAAFHGPAAHWRAERHLQRLLAEMGAFPAR